MKEKELLRKQDRNQQIRAANTRGRERFKEGEWPTVSDALDPIRSESWVSKQDQGGFLESGQPRVVGKVC